LNTPSMQATQMISPIFHFLTTPKVLYLKTPHYPNRILVYPIQLIQTHHPHHCCCSANPEPPTATYAQVSALRNHSTVADDHSIPVIFRKKRKKKGRKKTFRSLPTAPSRSVARDNRREPNVGYKKVRSEAKKKKKKKKQKKDRSKTHATGRMNEEKGLVCYGVSRRKHEVLKRVVVV